MFYMSAANTTKLGLSFSIALADAMAFGTLTRRVPRINHDYGNSCKSSLVSNELLKLKKRPTGMLGSLLSPNRYPLAYMFQVFQTYSGVCAFSFENQLLCNAMVFITTKSRFFFTRLLQMSSRVFTPALLKTLTKVMVMPANLLDRFSAEELAIGRDGNIVDSEIDSKRVFVIAWRRFWNFTASQQVKAAFVEDKIGLAASRFKQLLLSLAAEIRNVLSSFYSPDRDGLNYSIPSENAIIKGKGPKRLEIPLSLLVFFVGVGNFCSCSNDYLCGQVKARLNLFVNYFVQRVRLKICSFQAISLIASQAALAF